MPHLVIRYTLLIKTLFQINIQNFMISQMYNHLLDQTKMQMQKRKNLINISRNQQWRVEMVNCHSLGKTALTWCSQAWTRLMKMILMSLVHLEKLYRQSLMSIILIQIKKVSIVLKVTEVKYQKQRCNKLVWVRRRNKIHSIICKTNQWTMSFHLMITRNQLKEHRNKIILLKANRWNWTFQFKKVTARGNYMLHHKNYRRTQKEI